MARDFSPGYLRQDPYNSPITPNIIQDLMNLPKDDIRKRKNKMIVLNKMRVAPNNALKRLSQISLSSPHLRSKCFTLLRRHICKNSPKILSKVLIEVKPILLSCLEQVSDDENPMKLCKVVANVAFRLSKLEVGPWLELLDYIASSVNSDDKWTQELGLLMFRVFPEKIFEHLRNHFNWICPAVFRHMESTSGNLRKLACMAAPTLANLAKTLSKENEVQNLVPMIIVSINKSLDDQENREIVLSGLENLITAVIEQSTIMDENLRIMFQSMAEIAENQNVTPEVKARAFEFIREMDDLDWPKVSDALQNLPREIKEQCFLVWMDMLRLVDDVPDWHIVDGKDGTEKMEGETEAHNIGEYLLDRVSLLLKDEIFSFALDKIELFVAADQDWRKRLAGINTLYICSEGCSEELIDFYLERMVSLPLNILEDQDIHPRLCYAALRCVETLCRDWGPIIQSKYHVRILPVLAKLSCHPEHHRNQMHQAMAIIDCCHKCTPENLEPFLFAIVLKVRELCQSKSFLARAWAVSALGTVASSAQDRFTQFYETAMETLKDLLMRKYQVTRYNFKAKCLESISLIAAVIGKEKFQNDANQVMEVLVSILSCLKYHSTKIIIFKALENLFHCLGQDFSLFLKDLMPVLLLSCKLVGKKKNKGQSPQRSAENSLVLGVPSSELAMNAFACKLLSIFASEFKEIFFPWITEATSTLLLMLDLEFVNVRMEAAPAFPKLLEASTLAVEKGYSEGLTMSYVKNLVNLIIPALLKAFGKVVHKRLYATLFKSLSECMQISGPFIALDHITQITDRIQNGFSAYSLRKKVRVNEQKEVDPLKQIEEEQLFNEVSNCLVTLIQQYRANIMPNLSHRNLNLLIKNLWNDDCTYKEKKILICIFRNIMQECQEDAHQYYDLYLPPLLVSCLDDNLEVRQDAAIGITACAEFGTSKLKDIARGAMDFLPHVIRHLEELSVKNGNAHDIAVSVLKEVCESHGTSLCAHEGNSSDMIETSVSMKLNVGVLVQERHSIAAVVGRDSARRVCLLYSGMVPCTNTLQVEAHAIWLALICAFSDCWSSILVESESTDAVSQFNYRSPDCPPHIHSILESASNFGNNFSHMSFTHVDRIFNFVAHNFAKWALVNKKIGFVDFQEVPSSIFNDVRWAAKLGTQEMELT